MPPKSVADNFGSSALVARAFELSYTCWYGAVICCLFQSVMIWGSVPQVQKRGPRRRGAHPAALKLLSGSRTDPVPRRCCIAGSRAVRTRGLLAAGNSTLLEDTSRRRLVLMHCHGSERHSQSCHGPQGCFGALAENHHRLWLLSCFWNLPFFQLFGSGWYMAYEGGKNGDLRTRSGSCWQSFLDFKSGYHPGESKDGRPSSRRVPGLPGGDGSGWS